MGIKEEEEEEPEEQQEIIKPSATMRHGPGFMMDFEPTKLDHSRGELWRWLFSYLKPFRWKFTIFLFFYAPVFRC